MLQKAENSSLPFFDLKIFERDEDLPSSLRKRIATLKRQLRQDLKSRKNLRQAANARVETIFNLRNALLNWFTLQKEPVSDLLDGTREMVLFFQKNERFENIASLMNIMLEENKPLMEVMHRNGLDQSAARDDNKNVYEETAQSLMKLPDALAKVISDGIQGTCYLEYASILIMDSLDSDTLISDFKLKQLESVAMTGLKQWRKYKVLLFRAISEDELKNEKTVFQDLSLKGLGSAYSVEEPEYDYGMLISRNPKFKA